MYVAATRREPAGQREPTARSGSGWCCRCVAVPSIRDDRAGCGDSRRCQRTGGRPCPCSAVSAT